MLFERGVYPLAVSRVFVPLCSYSAITKRHTASGRPCLYSLSIATTSIPPTPPTVHIHLSALLYYTLFYLLSSVGKLFSSGYCLSCHLSVSFFLSLFCSRVCSVQPGFHFVFGSPEFSILLLFFFFSML